MASEKLTQLAALTTLVDADLMYVVHDTGTVPTSFQIAVQDMKTALNLSTFQVNGTTMISQNPVNFVQGNNVTITNPSAGIVQIDAGTVVTEVNGTPLISPNPINFVQGANITITNPSAGVIQIDAATQGSSTIFQVNGVTVSSSATINFVQSTNMTITNSSAGNINFQANSNIGGLTLVQHQIVTSAATSVTFSGLDGDTDGTYFLMGRIVNGAAANALYDLRPNNQTTNLTAASLTYNATNVTAVTAHTAWYIGAAWASVGYTTFEVYVFARKTVNGVSIPRYIQVTGGGDFGGTFQGRSAPGKWNETATNLTSLVIVCDQANGIGNGSEFWLYKYLQ